MIRVVYRWQVEPKDFEAFGETWRATTNRIHETVPGALGSFMLRSFENEAEVITVARWESRQAWEQFWGNQDPEAMQAMRTLGKRVSAEAFEEIEDHTR